MVKINNLSVRKNLIGEKFGKLSVTDLSKKNEKGLSIWTCKCDCGNTCFVRTDLLTSNKTKSCGCLRKLPKSQGSFNQLFLRYKKQAEARKLDFQISQELFGDLTKRNCFYCGIEPQQKQGSVKNNGNYIYNGIDRLNNSLGYVIENVVACCKTCNRAKDTLDAEQFKKIVKRMYLNMYKKATDKTPGELIDSLITVDIKCFVFQDKMMDTSLSESERLKLAEVILELNKKRNKLMRSIDVVLDFQDDMVTPKTYLPNLKEDSNPEF